MLKQCTKTDPATHKAINFHNDYFGLKSPPDQLVELAQSRPRFWVLLHHMIYLHEVWKSVNIELLSIAAAKTQTPLVITGIEGEGSSGEMQIDPAVGRVSCTT